jgi:hypothetical protein
MKNVPRGKPRDSKRTGAAAAQRIALLQEQFALRGATDEQLALVNTIVASHPRGAIGDDAWRLKGLILAGLDRHAEATVAFRRALSRRPRDTGLRVRLGISLIEDGKFKDGLRILKPIANRWTRRGHSDELEMELVVQFCADGFAGIGKSDDGVLIINRALATVRGRDLRAHLLRKRADLKRSTTAKGHVTNDDTLER